MRTIPLLVALSIGGLLPAAAVTPTPHESACTLSHGNDSQPLAFVYAARVPDPFYDGQRRVRIVCMTRALDASRLTDAEVSQWALQQEDTAEGFRAEIDADGKVVLVEVNSGGTLVQFSGHLSVAFDGAVEGARIRGRLTTEAPLDSTWIVAAELDLEIVETR